MTTETARNSPARPLSSPGCVGSGGMGHAGRAEEHQPVNALGLELVLNLGVPIGSQPGHVRQRSGSGVPPIVAPAAQSSHH